MIKFPPLTYGIWGRLLLAFGAIAMMTVLSVLTALFLLERSSDIFASLTERQLPELAQIAEFAEISGQIMAIAPSLASASNEDAQARVGADLDTLLVKFRNEIKYLEKSSPQLSSELDVQLSRLCENLAALQAEVARRLYHERLLAKHMERLRWLYPELLGEIKPLSQDLNYNMDAEIDRMISSDRHEDQEILVQRMRMNSKLKKIVDSIGSNGDFLLSLLLQASSARRESQVDNLSALAADITATLTIDLEVLPVDGSTLTLRQLLKEVFALAGGKEGVFAIKHDIISSETASEKILIENRRIVGKLRKSIDAIVTRSQQEARNAADITKLKLNRATWSQLGLVLLTLVIAAGVMWFYVRGSIVARLNALSIGMKAIADGDLNHPVPEAGSDEVGQMAAALRVFRDTARAVEDANAQAIIDNAAVGLIIAETDGEIRFFNPMAATLFAIDSTEMSGQSLFSFVSPQEEHLLRHACEEAANGQCDQIQDVYQGIKSDGTRFPVETVIRPIRQRMELRLMLTIHDVTEREEAEEVLRGRVKLKTVHLTRANAKLRQEVKERRRMQDELVQAGKLAALGQLTAGIAHELNQPLSAIRYYIHNARLLLQRGQLDTHEENIGKISELSERMAKMINHLKSFARRPSNELCSVDAIPAIEHALSLFNRRIVDHNIHVLRNFAERPYMIHAEEIRLEQVLVNILGNAIDAVSPQPEDKRTIAIDIVEDGDNLVIDVTDSGPGIPDEIREVIFDPFYTTKDVGKGLGLGLSISYNIVKDMHGVILASCCEGGGSKFSISFQKAEKNV